VAEGEVVAVGGRVACVACGEPLLIRGGWVAGGVLACGVLFGESGAVRECLCQLLEERPERGA
jgi:hypothetical protein